MSEHAVTHAPEWEVSVWPLVLSLGILFLCLAFTFQFVYASELWAFICLGAGTPLTLAGIAGWISEAIGGEHGEGLSTPAMGWFILAEAMIFVSFFANYWYQRLSADAWPPLGTPEAMPVIIPAIMTVALVTSSFTIHAGEVKLEQGDKAGFMKWLLITIVLGIAFLAMSGYEWNHLIHQGFIPATNEYSTSFYSITGFHGAHVLVGLGIFIAILLPALSGKLNTAFVKTGSLYWHFVDIIWLFVVSQVYYW
ncbi:MAG: heme-copper oxidase subunit III [Candidatus Thiodiazotropha sp.]